MFERFTETAIKIVMLAQEETRCLGCQEMGTGELLLGLIREDTEASRVLKEARVNLENARREIEKLVNRSSGFISKEKVIPFNAHATKVLKLALKEADQLEDNEITPEHLLLGLLQEEKSTAVRVLQNLGIEPAQIRSQILPDETSGT